MTKKEKAKDLNNYPDALTVSEVAEILRVSTKTVYKLINEEKIPAVKVGRAKRITKADLLDYLCPPRCICLHPKVKVLEETQKNVWTSDKTCDIVSVTKDKIFPKGVIKNANTQHPCRKRTG